MQQPPPTQLDQISSKRRLYLNASIACSLLASISIWIVLSFESDSDAFDRQAPLIHQRLDSLSDRLSQLGKKQAQLENEASGINTDNLAEYPESIRARFTEIEAEADEINSEIDALKSRINSLDRKFRTSPAQTVLIIIAAILAGLHLIFLLAHFNSRRVISLNNDATIATENEKKQLSYRSIEEDPIESSN